MTAPQGIAPRGVARGGTARRGIARPLLLPLTPFYAYAVSRRNERFDAAPSRTRSLTGPVVSVGSISAGGAGKTPFLVALANLLTAGGVPVDVLSRGYGRRSTTVAKVDPQGSAETFGDEPLLIARETCRPVYVGADRYAAGALAEREGVPRIHLLDDGFQHRQLGRQVDIALLTREDLEDALLPAGNLREGPEALSRAQILVVRSEEAAFLRDYLRRRFHAEPHLWTIRRSIVLAADAPRPLVFCGIARPHGLLGMLQRNGVTPQASTLFRDHHRYGKGDMLRLVREAKRSGAESFVTTAKDAVKLTKPMLDVLATAGPVVVADLVTAIAEPEQCVREIELLLDADRPRL